MKIRYLKLFSQIGLLLLTILSLGSCHEEKENEILFKEGLFLTDEFKYADQDVKLGFNFAKNAFDLVSDTYVHIYSHKIANNISSINLEMYLITPEKNIYFEIDRIDIDVIEEYYAKDDSIYAFEAFLVDKDYAGFIAFDYQFNDETIILNYYRQRLYYQNQLIGVELGEVFYEIKKFKI